MDLVCSAVDPVATLFQQVVNLSYTVLNWVGFSTPNIKDAIGDLIGCTF